MMLLIVIFMPIIATAIIISKSGISSFSPSCHLKHSTLDPLRGLAAVGVMAHHSFMMYNLMNGDLWRIKGSHFQISDYLFRFFESLGSIPVSLFFMLTAFLFFERLMLKRGAIDLAEFYFKRALRIIPMYLFMVACVMSLFLCFGINGGIKEFIATIISWSSFSLLPVISMSDKLIGGRAAAGVIWTLAIEWKFYFLIPLISIFTKTIRSSFLFIAA